MFPAGLGESSRQKKSQPESVRLALNPMPLRSSTVRRLVASIEKGYRFGLTGVERLEVHSQATDEITENPERVRFFRFAAARILELWVAEGIPSSIGVHV